VDKETKRDCKHGQCYEYIGGMSLRDWFAGMALNYSGNLLKASKAYLGDPYTTKDVAVICYEIAAAMIEQRKK